jgi:uncharacterized membrane protein YkvA (DUF1232 family)
VSKTEIKGKVDDIWHKAKDAVQKNERVQRILDVAVKKLNKLQGNKQERDNFFGRLQILVRMVQAHIAGEYHAFSNKTILMFVFALVYFITPVDMIPDFVPMPGFTDDITIIYYVVKNFAEDIEAFREWEAAH